MSVKRDGQIINKWNIIDKNGVILFILWYNKNIIISKYYMKKSLLYLSMFLGLVLFAGAGCNQANTNVGGGESDNTVSENVAVKTFEVSGESFKFTPAELKVNQGDRVVINFKNLQGFHDLVIDEFAVSTPQINGGQEARVEFVADKKGTFEYYCSVGKHRAMGMFGKLIVQ